MLQARVIEGARRRPPVTECGPHRACRRTPPLPARNVRLTLPVRAGAATAPSTRHIRWEHMA